MIKWTPSEESWVLFDLADIGRRYESSWDERNLELLFLIKYRARTKKPPEFSTQVVVKIKLMTINLEDWSQCLLRSLVTKYRGIKFPRLYENRNDR